MNRKNFKFFAIKKFVAPAASLAIMSAMVTMSACTQSDRTTESHEGMVENSQEAEQAEAQLAAVNPTAVADAKATDKKGGSEQKDRAIASTGKITSRTRRPASAGGVYVVQIGAFKVKENAEKLQASLKEAGFPVEMQTVEHSKNGVLHLVRFAPTPDKAKAEVALAEHARKDVQAQLLTLPSAAQK